MQSKPAETVCRLIAGSVKGKPKATCLHRWLFQKENGALHTTHLLIYCSAEKEKRNGTKFERSALPFSDPGRGRFL